MQDFSKKREAKEAIEILREKVVETLYGQWIDAANMVNFTGTLALAAGLLIGREYPGTTSHILMDLVLKDLMMGTEAGMQKAQEQGVTVPAAMATAWLDGECLRDRDADVLISLAEDVVTATHNVLGSSSDHLKAIKLLALHAGICIGLVESGKVRQELVRHASSHMRNGLSLAQGSPFFSAVANA